MTPGRRGLIVGSTLLAAGCATFDPARGHDQVAALVEERSGAQTGWGEGAPQAQQLADRVEALLAQGLTPPRAVAITLLNSPALQATYEELGVSQADMIQQGLLSNPELSVDLGFPTAQGIWEYSFGLVQEFVSLFMLPLKRQIAEERFLASILRVSHEALTAATRVQQEVIALQAAEEILALQRQALVAMEAASDLAQRQYAAGNILELEAARRRVAYEQLRVELAQSELALIAGRERINRLLGLWGPNTGWRLAGRLPELPTTEPTSEHLESLAIRQRLDVAAMRKEVSLLTTAAGLARSFRWFGKIEVGVHTHQDPDGPFLIGPDLTLELPIFDQRQALIGRLESQQRQAERRLTALSVRVRSEVREAQARVLSARRIAEHLETHVLPLHQRVLDTSMLQVNGMQLGLYALVDSKRAQLDAQRLQLETLRDYWTGHAELARLVGGRLDWPVPAERKEGQNAAPGARPPGAPGETTPQPQPQPQPEQDGTTPQAPRPPAPEGTHDHTKH